MFALAVKTVFFFLLSVKRSHLLYINLIGHFEAIKPENFRGMSMFYRLLTWIKPDMHWWAVTARDQTGIHTQLSLTAWRSASDLLAAYVAAVPLSTHHTILCVFKAQQFNLSKMTWNLTSQNLHEQMQSHTHTHLSSGSVLITSYTDLSRSAD